MNGKSICETAQKRIFAEAQTVFFGFIKLGIRADKIVGSVEAFF